MTDAVDKFVPSVHDTKGPVGAGLPQVELAIDDIAANAQKELSSEFKYNQDVNSGDMIGFSAHLLHSALYIFAHARPLIVQQAGPPSRYVVVANH